MFSSFSWCCDCCQPKYYKDEVSNPLAQNKEQIIASQKTIQLSKELLREQQKALEEKEKDDPVTDQSLINGMIEFSIRYDFDVKTLQLKILQARHLPAKDLGGTSDPYVKVSLMPEKTTALCTEIKHKNCNPKWNETFEFEDYPYQKLKQMTLFLQVLDYDRFTKDDPIGELKIPLSRFDLEKGQQLWKNLGYSQGKTIGRLGDLLLELTYDSPTLRLGVVRAKNLKARDINGFSDPYVKVWLLHENKKDQKRKTATKFSTLNPVYNEVMEFNVPIEKIRHASLEVSVIDYDKFGRNEAIGKIVLGSKTTPEQIKHWNEMFQNPRKTTSKWHVLREYD